MIRRPKATDTEEDLLSLQESFLASGELPSASLHRVSKLGAGVQVGEKRRELAGGGEEEWRDRPVGRDVVQLHPQGGGASLELESGKPPVKRSKFKERKEQAKMRKAPEDPFMEMERRDTHITKVLADIQEHQGFSASSVAMPTRMTKKGFPTVHQLDFSSLTAAPDSSSSTQTDSTPPEPQGGMAKPPKKKKSLFAQQLERHGLEYFGIEVNEEAGGMTHATAFKKDYVEPVTLGGSVLSFSSSAVVAGVDSGRMEGQSTTAMASGDTGQDMEVEDSGGVAREEFESGASQAWNRFLESSLISGEGLASMGVSSDAAHEEVTRIHRENVERLAGFSDEELLKEKERIQQTLGPEMLAFLKKRRSQKSTASRAPDGDKDTNMDVTEAQPTTKTAKNTIKDEKTDETFVPSEQSEPGKWLHMDIIEKEKMEWMTDVPLFPQNVDHSSPGEGEERREVRFSLDGLVIPRSVVLPAHLGLHHHGDEPQAAGYTLSELLPLCRSNVLQQRVLAINTLARIAQRGRQGEYTGVIEGLVVGRLLEAEVPLLLRYALDDSNDAVFFVAIHALHSLLVLMPEEYLLDNYLHCHHGNLLPSLRSVERSQRSSKDGEEEKETDTEILQRDVVEGLLNMQLLHRLRYILEVCRPPSLTVTEILELLTRVARHSLAAANQVVSCPRLMKVIFDEFLPLSWSWSDGGEGDEDDQSSGSKEEVAHGRPQVAALKLVMAVCSAGRNLTSQLVSQYGLLSVLTRYTVLHPTELNLPREEAYNLAIMALHTWTVTLSYAIGDTAFRDTYPVFLGQLQQLSSLSSGPHSLGQLEGRRISALLRLIQAAISIAGVTPDQLTTDKQNVTLSPPAIEWSHASGMLTPLLQCLTVWVEHTTTGATQVDRVSCVGSLLHCIASYYSNVTQKSPGSSLDVLDQIEKLANGVMNKLAKSALLSYALEALRKISVLSNGSSCGHDEGVHVQCSPPSLPSLLHLAPPPKRPLYNQSTTMTQADFHDLLQPQVVCFTCADLLLGYLRLCLVSAHHHKGVVNKVVQLFQNSVFLAYLEGVTQNNKNVQCSSFSFTELSLLYHVVKLFTVWLEVSGQDGMDESLLILFHHVAFKLVSLLPPGMECYIRDLISSAVLNCAMFRDSSSSSLVEKDITSLSLHDPPHPITAQMAAPASKEEPVTTSTLLSQSLDSLASLCSVYLQSLAKGGQCTEKQVKQSKSILHLKPMRVAKLMLPCYSGPCLPLDWVLLPLIQDYNKAVDPKKLSDAGTSESGAVVMSTLRLLLLLEHLWPEMLREVPISAKLVRLMCIFLIGNDLFLDCEVRSYLLILLRFYCQEQLLSSVDFTASIPGVASFTDLYSSLLEQFAAVSYGDHLFACFILLPLQQRFSVQLRKMVWKEHPTVIRILSLPITEIPINLNNYLYPVESDESMLETYMAALVSETLKSSWSPFFYLIAIHHLHSAIDNVETTPLRRRLLQSATQLKDEDTRRHLLLYCGLDETTPLGFKCNANLTKEPTFIISQCQ